MSPVDLVSLLAPLVALSILAVRDNVFAASLLLPTALIVALATFLAGFSFLGLLVLLIYIGVVIVLVVVAASAIEQTRGHSERARKVLPLIVLAALVPLIIRGKIAHVTPHGMDIKLLVVRWLPLMIILMVSALVIVLVALNISRRGLVQ